MWIIPPQADAEFVYRMEDVLTLYTLAYDAQRPVVCMDENSKQLVSETHVPLPLQPGQPAKYDYQYQREGVCSLFMFVEPLTGQRYVHVRAHRTKADWIAEMKWLAEIIYPHVSVIRVVLDNLNTHNPSASYEALVPAEARRLLDRFEFHYTPKHASWLNIAEIELSVLSRQCLSRRIPNPEELQDEAKTWEVKRNQACRLINWQFTTLEARIKLKQLYSSYLP